MAELCLMASRGYTPALFFHPSEHGAGRISREYQHFLSNPALSQDSLRLCLMNQMLHQFGEPLKLIIEIPEDTRFFRTNLSIRKPVLLDIQDFPPDMILPVLPYYEGSCLSAELQPSLISPFSEFSSQKPLFLGDLGHSYHTHPPDGQQSFTSLGRTEMKNVLATFSEHYISNNSMKWKKQPMLVPYFNRKVRRAKNNVDGSSSKLEPVKSFEKVKYRTSPKKKSNVKAGKERDLHRNNYLHACESLLTIMVDKKLHGRNAIHSLKRSSPEIPELLTQFSASIAGTGLAVIISVVCKVACGRVPFCTSKLLNTGLGLGLVWLSWAVNRLRDTVISINKKSGKLGNGEEEMMSNLDGSVRDIYFRAVTLMAVVVLKLA